MEWWKILSLVIAAIYVFGAVLSLAGDDADSRDIYETAFGVLIWLLISLGCIWYGDELGDGLVGAKFGLISSRSPGWAVAFIGWVFLLAPGLVALFYKLSRSEM